MKEHLKKIELFDTTLRDGTQGRVLTCPLGTGGGGEGKGGDSGWRRINKKKIDMMRRVDGQLYRRGDRYNNQ